MKVDLVFDESCEFTKTVDLTGVTKTGSVTLTQESISSYTYTDRVDDDRLRFVGGRECNMFKTHLNEEHFWNKSRELSVFLKINPSKRNSIHLKVQGECLSDICHIFGSDCKFQLLLVNEKIETILDSNEILITNQSNDTRKRFKYDAYFEDQKKEISDDMFSWMIGSRTTLLICISITGSFHKSICDADVPNKSSIYAKMLNEKIETDVEMVAIDGTSIPCHKAFLIAQSSEFAKILQNDKEKKIKIIKTDIPARSLKPFLDYLYSYEVSSPIGDPQIAIDLLKYSQQYNVKEMETKMAKILYESQEDAFTVDEALQLLFLVRNTGKVGNYDLKRKAIRIFHDFKFGDVFKSEELKNFFESPAALEAVTEIIKAVGDE